MVKRKKNGGFATAISSVLALTVATTGLYVVKVQEEYKDVKVVGELAKKTANRVKKIEMAATTYEASQGTAPQSCQDLVNVNLISPNDCKDALGNPIQVSNRGGTVNINVSIPKGGMGDFVDHYAQDVAEQIQKIGQEYQNNIAKEMGGVPMSTGGVGNFANDVQDAEEQTKNFTQDMVRNF